MVKVVANVNRLNKFLNWKPKLHELSTMVKSPIHFEKQLNKV